ncbi:hypothetical protein Ddc_23925 [Ditylenchus destructor]|nr:hypothetical protein Ddc_23925 [Ditylenchus destructor]
MLKQLYGSLAPGARPMLWVEAHREEGDPAWNEERARLLNRLNEQRGRLEAEVGPMLLLVPADFMRETLSLAQDLWHARYLSLALEADDEPEAAQAGAAKALAATQADVSWLSRDDDLDAPLKDVDEELAHWDAELGPRLATVEDVRSGALRDFWIPDAVSALRRAVKDDRLPSARLLAERVVSLARARSQAQAGVDGYVRWSDGTLDEAAARYREAASLCRSALAVAPDDADDQQLLARVLDDQARLAERLGDLEAGVAMAEEALALRRRLLATSGDEPASMRELAYGLESMARLYRRLGSLSRAARALVEAVDLRQAAAKADEALGVDDPKAVRRLADARQLLGELRLLRGEPDLAVEQHAASVGLRRVLAEDGEDADSRLALVLGLESLAIAAGVARMPELADDAWEEALALAREQLAADGPTRAALETLGDLLVNRISSEAPDPPEWRAEAVDIFSQLVERFPEDSKTSLYASILQELRNPTQA